MKSVGSSMCVCAHFSGRVQGVGFRYTAAQKASQVKVCGYVRNLGNGDVELVAEGLKTELLELLDLIRGSQVGQFIRDEHLDWSPATNEFKSFRISD